MNVFKAFNEGVGETKHVVVLYEIGSIKPRLIGGARAKIQTVP